MILIGEKLNGFIPAMGQAIAARKESYVRKWARKQWEAGANYLDVCASGAEGELDALLWLMDVVQSEVDAPLSLDSPNAHVLEAAMRHAKRPALINSISLEGGKAQRLLPQIAAQGHSCVALLLHDGVPADVEGRMQAFERILALADDCGLPRGRLFIDPLVTALATDEEGDAFAVFAQCCREIRACQAGVHIIAGASNVSFGLPARKHVNRAFLALALSAGLDSAICDPTAPDIQGILYAARALLGEDELCGEYLRAYRSGRFC